MTTVTDPDKGTVTKVTDPVGQEVNSQYDALRRLTKTSTMLNSQEVKTDNTYQAQTGYLASTTHNTDSNGGSVTYNFAYDTLGRQVSVAVGSNVLSTTYYDAQGKPAIVIFNGTAYGYLYNLQGDVVALVDGTGAKVVEYRYDAWGKPISKTGTLAETLGTVQPFRYRGYVYDEETGDYYLRSRYYRAEWGRFVTSDIIAGGNQYRYCNDDPIQQCDYDGLHPVCYEPDDPYKYYGVDKNIAEAIDIITQDEETYAYSDKAKDGSYNHGIHPCPVDEEVICVCCVYLLCGLLGGSWNMGGMKQRSGAKKITKKTNIKPGMIVFQGSRHCGLVIMYNFGHGYELAVFQSVSVPKLSEGKLYDRAKFMNDANAGPNITPFIRSNWDYYGTPTIMNTHRFFFDSSNKWYLWK